MMEVSAADVQLGATRSCRAVDISEAGWNGGADRRCGSAGDHCDPAAQGLLVCRCHKGKREEGCGKGG